MSPQPPSRALLSFGDGGHDGDGVMMTQFDGDYFSGPSVENALVHDRELWGRPNSPFQPDQIMLIMIYHDIR